MGKLDNSRGQALSPNGRWYKANSLEQIEQVFGIARLWHQDYNRQNKEHLSVVLPFQLPPILKLQRGDCHD